MLPLFKLVSKEIRDEIDFWIFVVAVNEKLLSIPIQFKNCRIGQKPKVGRKPKAKKGDALKRN